MTYWNVPSLWAERTVVIYASGPSMNQGVVEATRHLPAIVINDTFRLAPDANVLYAADDDWWKENPDAQIFPGLKVTIGEKCKLNFIYKLRNTGNKGFDPDRSCLRTGGNSGYQALHLAIHGDAKRVLLCGYDMSNKKGDHWFGKHKAPLKQTDPDSYKNWAKRFDDLAKVAAVRSVEIINCTLDSAISAFPIRSLSSVL